MQYKTTIEVVTEADSEHEAADIAGEFLKGNINGGAEIKVSTISAAKSKGIKALLAICLTSAALSVLVVGGKIPYRFAKTEKKPVTSYAIQPPLKSSLADIQNSQEFKRIWEKEHKDRLDSIAR